MRNHRVAAEFAALVGGIEPDAIMAMSKDDQLVLIEGGTPRRCRRVPRSEKATSSGIYDAPGLRPRAASGKGFER